MHAVQRQKFLLTGSPVADHGLLWPSPPPGGRSIEAARCRPLASALRSGARRRSDAGRGAIVVVGGAQGFIAPQWVAAQRPRCRQRSVLWMRRSANNVGAMTHMSSSSPSATWCKTSYQPLHGGYMTHKTEDPRKKDPGA